MSTFVAPSTDTDSLCFIPPPDLWAAVRRQTAHALECGALQPIGTEVSTIQQSGIRFVIRVASSLRRKDAAKDREKEDATTAGVRANPFLPYERAMFVADLTPTHICLLNKYNVLPHHLLIVTRDYVDQETLITREDFAALTLCMSQTDGLGFYNAGPDAGASQPHKHIQLAPLPLSLDGPAVPIEAALATVPEDAGAIRTVPLFPFRHAFCRLDPAAFTVPTAVADGVHRLYRRMLADLGIGERRDGRQSQAYNLLLTRRWMLLVPRSAESFGDISVNALNFAGAMFVRSEAQFRVIEEAGPLAILSAVGFPRIGPG